MNNLSSLHPLCRYVEEEEAHRTEEARLTIKRKKEVKGHQKCALSKISILIKQIHKLPHKR